jgi:glycine/D-amino acid oxidase-like deaminating enzyme
MPPKQSEIVICGAGILGISAAYFLAVEHGITDITLVDSRPPLTLTSDKSTECYRNWWPGPGDAMLRLHNGSIDWLEEFSRRSGDAFHLNRRGYLYVSTAEDGLARLAAGAWEASALGAGELRLHQSGSRTYAAAPPEGWEDQPEGADLLLDAELIREHYPYLSPDVTAALHVRRAGWLSAQQYGAWLLERARSAGVRLVAGRVAAVETSGGAVSSVTLDDGSTFNCSTFINAAGPYLADVGQLLGAEIPVYNELHLKASFEDAQGVLPREAPLVICADPQTLEWSDEERDFLAEDPQTARLLTELPAGAHTRPEGSAAAQSVLALWDVHDEQVEAQYPLPEDPMYTELALRGLTRIIPGMQAYLERMPRPFVDGGYYTKTQENRPLAGPLPVAGAYVIGAAAGYGIMASAGLAELLAAHITGADLPGYAAAFDLARYQDADYQQLLANWGESWQL